LSARTLVGKVAGDVLWNIDNGTGLDNFGWLTWAGSPNNPTLVQSLTPPGDSDTYINPYNAADHKVSPGDWVQGQDGAPNSSEMQAALNTLQTIDIVIPVWDIEQGTGSNILYRVVNFAGIRLLAYDLSDQDQISVLFLGYSTCP
jgi:hypothetical protein